MTSVVKLSPFKAAGLLALAIAAVYANCISAPFVFDDRPAILANPTLHSFFSALSPARDGGTTAGRPVVNLSLALNHAISGTKPWSYHGFNLLVHLLGTWTLFGLVRRTLVRRGHAHATGISFLAAAIWALHPLQTSAVTYVVQRAESLMALCFLTTLWCFARAIADDGGAPRRTTVWLTLSALACLAGMACKEVMVVAPLVVLLYDRTFVSGSFVGALRLRGVYYGALAASWMLLGWLVMTQGARSGTAGFGGKIAWTDYALTQCTAILTYLKLTVWPSSLVFDYGTPIAAFATAAPAAMVVALLIFAAAFGTYRASAAGFLLTAFLLILAPTSSVMPIHTQTIAEHRMYLPLAVVAVGAAVGVAALRKTPLATVLPFVLALGFLTIARNRDYRDALTLWSDTAAKRPDNARAHNNAGIELARARRPREAAEHFTHALQFAPDDAELHNNLGNVLAQLGRDAEALTHFERSATLQPKSSATQLNLANALTRLDRPDDATRHFEFAEAIAPLDADAQTSFGAALAQAGRWPSAIDRYRKALAVDPANARAHYNLGLAFARTGRFSDAVSSLTTCVQLEPRNVAARVNLANSLLLSGRRADAIDEYEAALKLNPDDPQIRANLARARNSRESRE